MKKFYSVLVGRKPGVYTQWFGSNGANAQIKGFPKARYKGFATRIEAQEWLKNPSVVPKKHKKQSENYSVDKTVIYTDGGCLNNPGPGGYGIVAYVKGEKIELSGGFALTTNNRMELMACIVAIETFKPADAILYSDSKYVVDGITKGWALKWESNGWKKSNGDLALNIDLWKRLLDLTSKYSVEFKWVKGHAQNQGNERCDVLANLAIKKGNLSKDTGYSKNSYTGNSFQKK